MAATLDNFSFGIFGAEVDFRVGQLGGKPQRMTQFQSCVNLAAASQATQSSPVRRQASQGLLSAAARCDGGFEKSQMAQSVKPIGFSLSVTHWPSGHPDPLVDSLLSDVITALNTGGYFVPLDDSSAMGQSYLVKDVTGMSVAVFKPRDEEPLGPNNRKTRNSRTLGAVGQKPGIPVGGGAIREAAAYILDRRFGLPAGVPVTAVVELQHPFFAENEEPVVKVGALQRYVQNEGSAEDFGPFCFEEEDARRIAMLDIRLQNADRHSGNFLIVPTAQQSSRQTRRFNLVPIDHGCSFPEAFTYLYLEWKSWPAASRPFSDAEIAAIQAIDPAEDAAILRELGLPEASVRGMVAATRLLQAAARAGRTLADIASVMERQVLDGGEEGPSEFELALARHRVSAQKALSSAPDRSSSREQSEPESPPSLPRRPRDTPRPPTPAPASAFDAFDTPHAPALVGFHALASAAVACGDVVTGPLVQAAVHVFHVTSAPEPPEPPATNEAEPPGLPLRFVLHNVLLEQVQHVVQMACNEPEPRLGAPLQYRQSVGTETVACSSYCHVARSPEEAAFGASFGGGFHAAWRGVDVSRGGDGIEVESVSDILDGESLCEDDLFRFGYEDEHGRAESVGICRRLSGHLSDGGFQEAIMQALEELGEGHMGVDAAWSIPFMFTVETGGPAGADGDHTEEGIAGPSSNCHEAADVSNRRGDTASTNDKLYRGLQAAKLAHPSSSPQLSPGCTGGEDGVGGVFQRSDVESSRVKLGKESAGGGYRPGVTSAQLRGIRVASVDLPEVSDAEVKEHVASWEVKVKLGDRDYDEYEEVVYELLGGMKTSMWELYEDSLEGALERALSGSDADLTVPVASAK